MHDWIKFYMTGIDLHVLIKLLNGMQEWYGYMTCMMTKRLIIELILSVIHARYQLKLILNDIDLLNDMQFVVYKNWYS